MTDKNSTILWEPGGQPTPVQYYNCLAQIIATVSPDKYLCHSFKKMQVGTT
jgi:hypothetical protein